MRISPFALLGVAGVVIGCGGSPASAPPLAPTPLPNETAPACSPRLTCELLSFRVSGFATDDDGRPVPGVRVTLAPWKFGQVPPRISLVTDARGFYEAQFEAMRDAVGGVGNAVAEQSGYETHAHYLGPAVPQEITQNFHLYRIRRITPGESVALVVRPDDPSCGFDDEWVCRRVRIVAARAGTLTIILTSQNPQDQTGLEVTESVPPGVPFRPKCCSPEVSVKVDAGAEMVANVLVWWETKVNHAFTLATAFEP